jgi:hypothetical protein
VGKHISRHAYLFDRNSSFYLTTDELIDGIADLAAGLNPIVRDARRVSENLEKEDEDED